MARQCRLRRGGQTSGRCDENRISAILHTQEHPKSQILFIFSIFNRRPTICTDRLTFDLSQLATICEQKFGSKDERCMLFPSNNYALACREFVTRMSPSPSPCVRIVHFVICPGRGNGNKEDRMNSGDLHIIFFPASHWPVSKSFWQHTGTGISSRFAEHCLRLLLLQADRQNSTRGQTDADVVAPPRSPIHGRNRHYFSKRHSRSASFPPPTTSTSSGEGWNAEEEIATIEYLEERYARNLHPNAAAEAKRTLRRRIAGVLVRDDGSSNGSSPTTRRHNGDGEDAVTGPSTRGVPNITEDDVFLFSGGMCAIWHTHQLLLNVLGSRKSVCWGCVHIHHWAYYFWKH